MRSTSNFLDVNPSSWSALRFVGDVFKLLTTASQSTHVLDWLTLFDQLDSMGRNSHVRCGKVYRMHTLHAWCTRGPSCVAIPYVCIHSNTNLPFCFGRVGADDSGDQVPEVHVATGCGQ